MSSARRPLPKTTYLSGQRWNSTVIFYDTSGSLLPPHQFDSARAVKSCITLKTASWGSFCASSQHIFCVHPAEAWGTDVCLKHEITSSDYNNNNALIQLEKRLDIICGLGLVDLGHFAQYFHICMNVDNSIHISLEVINQIKKKNTDDNRKCSTEQSWINHENVSIKYEAWVRYLKLYYLYFLGSLGDLMISLSPILSSPSPPRPLSPFPAAWFSSKDTGSSAEAPDGTDPGESAAGKLVDLFVCGILSRGDGTPALQTDSAARVQTTGQLNATGSLVLSTETHRVSLNRAIMEACFHRWVWPLGGKKNHINTIRAIASSAKMQLKCWVMNDFEEIC